MNRRMNRRAVVIATALVALCFFAGAVIIYSRSGDARAGADTFVRSHSPIIGPAAAPVTIVEFFDPACEACRAMYPYVQRLLASYPTQVRLVMRYTPLHAGSDEAVRILEAARAQGKFETVLEALLARQADWASHGAPNLEQAWQLAGLAGLDLEMGRREGFAPAVDRVLKQDMADARANGVRQTPTFFVNGKALTSFGPQQLYTLVRQEVRRVEAGS